MVVVVLGTPGKDGRNPEKRDRKGRGRGKMNTEARRKVQRGRGIDP